MSNCNSSSVSDDITTSASNKKEFILRYPGSCITFNLMQASRVKKNRTTISEEWVSDENDKFLIIRLIETNGRPWLVVHHGIYEVAKAPLFVPAEISRDDSSSVCVFLRDHANRGESNCIRREFKFKFNSLAEARSFVFSHNSFISSNKGESTVDHVTNRRLKRPRAKRYRDDSSSSEDEKEKSHLGNYKGRRVVGSRGNRERKKIKHGNNQEVDDTSIALSHFWIGNKANELDDHFENTPTPWGDSED